MPNTNNAGKFRSCNPIHTSINLPTIIPILENLILGSALNLEYITFTTKNAAQEYYFL